jgi:alkylation response protein AidB-like acyl-CoA dehydrogenase
MSEELLEETRALDFLDLDALLTDEERGVRDDTRRFVQERLKPNIQEWWERAIFPQEIVPEMASLGLLGMHLNGYGCAGKSAVTYGLSCTELEAGDSGRGMGPNRRRNPRFSGTHQYTGLLRHRYSTQSVAARFRTMRVGSRGLPAPCRGDASGG